MANHHVIRTPRLTDHQILELFSALRDGIPVTHVSFESVAGAMIELSSQQISDELLDEMDSDYHVISRAILTTTYDIRISVLRGICDNVDNPNASRKPSPYFDEIVLRHSDLVSGIEGFIFIKLCVSIIEKHIPKTLSLADDDKSNVIDILQSEMASLSKQHAKMLSDLSTERAEYRRLTDEVNQKSEEERRAFKERSQRESNEEMERFQQYRSEEESNLQQRETKLDEREKTLDDRQHVHVRRELRKQITEKYSARRNLPTVAKKSISLRMIIFGLTLFSGVLLGGFGVYSFNQSIQFSDIPNISHWIIIGLSLRGTISMILAVGFVAYAINWLRVVYLDDVRIGRRYVSNSDDIDRASFVIETIMEVGEKEKTEMPNAWIEGVCRNLFTDRNESNDGKAPTSALSLLLDLIAGAKFGTEGAEVSVDRRGTRQLKKKLARE